MKFSTTTYTIEDHAAIITQRFFEDDNEVDRVVAVLDTPSSNLRFDADQSTVAVEHAAGTLLYLARYVRREKVRQDLRIARLHHKS